MAITNNNSSSMTPITGGRILKLLVLIPPRTRIPKGLRTDHILNPPRIKIIITNSKHSNNSNSSSRPSSSSCIVPPRHLETPLYPNLRTTRLRQFTPRPTLHAARSIMTIPSIMVNTRRVTLAVVLVFPPDTVVPVKGQEGTTAAVADTTGDTIRRRHIPIRTLRRRRIMF